MNEDTKKALAAADKAIGQSEKRAREQSYEAKLSMAIDDADKKRIEKQKMQFDAQRKKLKEQQKVRRIEHKKYMQGIKKRYQQPRLGVAPKEQTIKGGATKFLKRI